MAQGTVDSLLGRLTALLLDEAQLLGSVRGDVEFIKDEMETMNGLLLHLTEAQRRDHQVRAWMRQVAGLARDCEGSIELYIRRVVGVGELHGGQGLLRHLQQLLRLLRTIPARHRIARRIRDLKDRARDVSDRRVRYGVTVPASATAGHDDAGAQSPRLDAGDEEDVRRRALLDFEPPDDFDIINRSIDTLVEWLLEEPAPPGGDGSTPPMRVFVVLGWQWAISRVLKGAYQHSTVVNTFNCRGWVMLNYCFRGSYLSESKKARDFLKGVLDQISVCELADGLIREKQTPTSHSNNDEKLIGGLVQGCLKGTRSLIVFDDNTYHIPWERESVISSLLHPDGCLPGSTIIVTKMSGNASIPPCPYKVLEVEDPTKAFFTTAEGLAARTQHWSPYALRGLFEECYPSAFAMKMFLHLLCANPNMESIVWSIYSNTVGDSHNKRVKKSIAKQALMFCYKELPRKYKSCLLYLVIFPKGQIIRASSLARRWVSEGLIAATSRDDKDDSKHQASTIHDAAHYLDVLVTRGFIQPVEISAAGDVKRFTVHNEVREFITMIARDVNFVDSNLTPDLAHHISIYNRIGLQRSHSDVDGDDILAFLPSLAASFQWQFLKVLDLEGCKGFKKNHLKIICKILLLKYLSLRNTDVTELPKQIKELQCLETLDIRETMIQVLARKAIVLPLLKHFLAGHKASSRNNAKESEESICSVHMPNGIQRMKNIEILSCVKVINSDIELAGIPQLLKLRKLGVALNGENAKLTDLFRQVEELHRCLRSLSIHIDQPAAPENSVVDLPSPPQFIERLNISGLTRGVPQMIQELHQLVKLTLTGSYIKEDMLRILGKLHGLCYLRLQHKSYIERELSFKEDEFRSLKFLLVEGEDISSISFVMGAAPTLERIVWSFTTMEALSGRGHLPKIKKLELNGECNIDSVTAAIEAHPNHPVLKHNSQYQRQEDKTTATTSSSSSAP